MMHQEDGMTGVALITLSSGSLRGALSTTQVKNPAPRRVQVPGSTCPQQGARHNSLGSLLTAAGCSAPLHAQAGKDTGREQGQRGAQRESGGQLTCMLT